MYPFRIGCSHIHIDKEASIKQPYWNFQTPAIVIKMSDRLIRSTGSYCIMGLPKAPSTVAGGSFCNLYSALWLLSNYLSLIGSSIPVHRHTNCFWVTVLECKGNPCSNWYLQCGRSRGYSWKLGNILELQLFHVLQKSLAWCCTCARTHLYL